MLSHMQNTRLHLDPIAIAASVTVALDAADITGMDALEAAARLGIGIDSGMLSMMARAAMDANVLTPTTYPGTATTPLQFLQSWLPGIVRTVTAARKIDLLAGLTVAGDWADEEIIQQTLEPTGFAVLYGDYTNVPLNSWNPGWERRSVIRFEAGARVGKLEEARAAKVNINSGAEKRASAALNLELIRNRVGFYGYNGGANRTYGFLNDPALPAYVTVPNGVSGSPLWSQKTFLEITADIRNAAGALQNQSGDTIDPMRTPMILAVATIAAQFLAVVSDYGVSVRQWLTETYPDLTIVSAPELNAANGGANVFYLYAVKLEDGSTDDGAVFAQIVPAKFQALGIEQQAKAYVEDYTNALAGIMLKRPFAVVRRSGI